MSEFRTTDGYTVTVDEFDLPLIGRSRWYSLRKNGNVYVRRNIKENGKWKSQKLHQFLWAHWYGCAAKIIDHINGDGLDNRRSNLRSVSAEQNMWNRKSRIGSSKYKGVVMNKNTGKWRVDIRFGNKNHTIGYFESEDSAARVYDAWAKEAHGEFAKLNNPP